MMDQISIVTATLNHARYSTQTIESVLSQNHPRTEHLVIDGGSTDDTLDILRQYERVLDWTSEPDDGQAQAINKGLKKSTGEIVTWLNSDDVYLPGTLNRIAGFFDRHPTVDAIYGDYQLIDCC